MDGEGFTPIMYASKHCNMMAVKALLEAGADIRVPDIMTLSGFTLLDFLLDARNPWSAKYETLPPVLDLPLCHANTNRARHL